MDSVGEWLQGIALQQYGNAFQKDGWDDMDSILTMTEQDVKSVVQKTGHIRKICLSITKLNNESQDQQASQLTCDRGTHLLYSEGHEMVGTVSESSKDGSDVGINEQATVAQQDTAMSLTKNNFIKNIKNITTVENLQLMSTPDTQNTESNYGSQILSCLETYREREKLFGKTRAYKEANDILEDRNWVDIIGNPGDGKSTIAHQLLLDHNKKGFDAVIVTSPHVWRTMVTGKRKQSNKQIVLIDDMFGVTNVHDNIVNDWLSLLEMMTTVVSNRKGSLKVVCTNRKSVFNQVDIDTVKFKMFGKLSILDLTVQPFLLSFEERATILKTYFKHYCISNFDIAVIASIDSNYGFPHRVEIFCTNSIIRNKQGVEFFKNEVPYSLFCSLKQKLTYVFGFVYAFVKKLWNIFTEKGSFLGLFQNALPMTN